MKLNKEMSLQKHINNKLQTEELMKMSKEDLIKRYFYRIKSVGSTMFLFGVWLGMLLFLFGIKCLL
jgi:hypothetical protein